MVSGHVIEWIVSKCTGVEQEWEASGVGGWKNGK